jgi:NADH:ubiquinone oxidoreductase subunit D
MNKTLLRQGNVYRVNNGKVQFMLAGYYPEEEKVLLRFGKWPVKAHVDSLKGVTIDSFLLQQYGFVQDPYGQKFWQRGAMIVYLISKGEYRVAYGTHVYDRIFNYLHQLQNIYNKHTGEEL